jgi:DNA-binding response OmpR family regulator
MNTTILLLVSDASVRKVLGDALESDGHVVLPAGDIGTAVDRLKESTSDLLIVRHYIESMSGHDAAMYLRKLCPGMPVLLVGGIPDDLWLQSRDSVHGFEIFPKPFKVDELLARVREILSARPQPPSTSSRP